MYKKAAERAGTLDSQAVRKELEKFKDEPIMGGIATFTKDIHIQNRIRALINEVKDGKMKSTGEYYTSEKAVPSRCCSRNRHLDRNTLGKSAAGGFLRPLFHGAAYSVSR